MKNKPKNKEIKMVSTLMGIVFIKCSECQQEAPVIKGEYKLVHDKHCSKSSPL